MSIQILFTRWYPPSPAAAADIRYCLPSPSPRDCPGLIVPEVCRKVCPQHWRLAGGGRLIQGITACPSGLCGALYASELPMELGLGETSETTSMTFSCPVLFPSVPYRALSRNHTRILKCHFQGTWLNRKLSKEDWPRKMLNKPEDAEHFFSNRENHQKYIFPLLIALEK